MKANDDVIDVLARSQVFVGTDDSTLHLPEGQLHRSLYEAVNKALVALGGKWDRRAKAHLFPTDVSEQIEQLILTGEYTDAKREFDAFYTPPELADTAVELADIRPGQSVLEPSFGDGALVRSVIARWVVQDASVGAQQIEGYELRQKPLVLPQALLEVEFLGHWDTDFLSVEPQDRFDRVVMNPPFSKQQDMKHVWHAFDFLKPGGRLVAIMSPAWQFRDTREARLIRGLYAECGEDVTHLDAGTFKESGTMIRSTIVVFQR